MSYFETKLCNDWSYPEACKFYVHLYKDDKVAFQQMKKDLFTITENPNYNSFTRKKANLFATKIPISSIETDSYSNSNLLSSNSTPSNQTFYMGNQNTVNNVINNNGKRAADQDDPFSQPGEENSRFFNKLLKTYCEEDDPSSNETEEEVEDDALNIEDDLIFQEEIVYENGENDELSAIADFVKLWKVTAEHQPLIHKQVLLYYNIIDLSLDGIPPLTSKCLEFIKSLKTTTYKIPTQVHPLNLDFSSCHTFSRFKSFYDNEKSKLPYSVKKMIKTYLNQKYEENVNLFADIGQKENDYKLHFVAPLYKALFRQNQLIKKEWGESLVGKTKVDGLLSILDEEGVITTLSVIEVSGPWSVTNKTHFLKDKKKIAKNLKLIMNQIYYMNTTGGSRIKKVKLYGLQLYKKNFHVYSLQLICPKLYVFKEEMKFDYPTSPSFFRSQLPIFMTNMLTLKSLIESSLENVLLFLNDDETDCSEEYDRFIDSTENSPQDKKK
ncbi:uncharacterized protein B0P05DRAFT_216927 [Gilbertella persicaria]|uniref:Uncharacterized protein n=1 Tax=Rhizopus stolonifer TaxID=4846 RepID=A0A367K8U4_RHIST|nr:uncharacterized protein B0P05DRAFT_216927 [Gilbertella persicaria]KAI8092129.1 hypothetical protein B0P05DRAFT_216927 [Gilbertella persicaria]RCH98605.1 hypothetical protein CU098_001409 [Rhizopus stolonifer]